ncbi:MAG: alpha-amylase family glycosyl hydrolase [Pseudomonadota bacterium]
MDALNRTDKKGTPEISEAAWQRIRARLVYLYGEEQADALVARIAVIAHNHVEHRPIRRTGALWSQKDVCLITYGDSVQNPSERPLETLGKFLHENLKDLVTTVHILPFYPSSSDGGFSVVDYQTVDPDLGGWPDIHTISEDFDIMFDFVLNHVSRESLWFTDFLEHIAPGKDYFIEIDPRENLSTVVRPRTSPLLVKIEARHETRHVWATFSHDQIDLNYANPDVLVAMLKTLLFYVRNGARAVRLDAVAFLWKEIGTSCIHLPQTHEIVKLFRDVLGELEPSCVLLTETNVPHHENISYFGDGDEAHAVYQFALPPLLLQAIISGCTRHLRDWAASLEPLPPNCTYFNFTASHDGIGLRALENMIPRAAEDELVDAMRQRGGFVSSRLSEEGKEVPYELNISYFDAMGGPDADTWQIPRFLLSQTVALSLQGVPGIYVLSLLATPNDLQGVERTGQTRSINRRKWDCRELEELLADPMTAHAQVFSELRRRLEVRREQSAFHPNADQRIVYLYTPLFCILRESRETGQRIFCLFNFTATPVELPKSALGVTADVNFIDLLDETPGWMVKGQITLPAYATRWLTPTSA